MRTLAVLVVACVAVTPPAVAQRVHDVPPRPPLGSIADTNSPTEYFEEGTRLFATDPVRAAAAFYWASRLDPETAEYLYARRMALMLTNPTRLLRYDRYDRATLADPEILAIDSLYRRALMINPFLHTALDDRYQFEIVRLILDEIVRRQGGALEATDMQFAVQYYADRDPAYAANLSFSRGNFSEALDFWGRAARRSNRNSYIRARRATAFYLMGSLDSARAQLAEALTIARRRDADSVRFFYESKAQWEFALGRVHERLGNGAAAREAYERALVEDLGYYPGHVRLGLTHIGAGDTTAAMREFARAIAVKEDEYISRTTYAYFLAATGRLDSAATHLRRAADLEPFAANPRLMLGSVLDALGDRAGAVDAFTAYLARAMRRDPDRPTIQARVQSLRGRE